MPPARPGPLLLPLLGALSVVSPFAIDMYLPAFEDVGRDFGVPETRIALTLSAYFIGLAAGQVAYGPLLDRYGRKRPLAAGLAVFIAASLGCAAAPTLNVLVGLRFVQAFGGCVAQVAAIAMVRDFFPREQAARVLSRLFLFIAVSPLLAPTIGTFVIRAAGWRAAFVALAAVVGGILALVLAKLPEGHAPDRGVSLRPGPLLAGYAAILRRPRFHVYAGAGAFAFAGLFAFVAGSPILFMVGFKLDKVEYSLVFALLAGGFIAASQANVALLKRWSSETLFLVFLVGQVVFGTLFLAGTWFDVLGLGGTLAVMLGFMACVGITNPNASALAVAPFARNAGRASALLGFFQLGAGALISTAVDAATPEDRLPIVAIFPITAAIGLVLLLLGRKAARGDTAVEDLPAEGMAAPTGTTQDEKDRTLSEAPAA